MIAVVSGWNEAMTPLCEVTWPNKLRYCARHGYEAVSYVGEVDRHPVWTRIRAGIDALPHHEWIFLVDADTLITNPELRLESFLDTEADLIATYDINGLNTGSLFIRNTEWSRDFFDYLWEQGPRWAGFPNPEQTMIAYLLYKHPKAKWEARPQRQFNSFKYAEYGQTFPEGEYQEGDFLLHLPALSNERRLEVFRSVEAR